MRNLATIQNLQNQADLELHRAKDLHANLQTSNNSRSTNVRAYCWRWAAYPHLKSCLNQDRPIKLTKSMKLMKPTKLGHEMSIEKRKAAGKKEKLREKGKILKKERKEFKRNMFYFGRHGICINREVSH